MALSEKASVLYLTTRLREGAQHLFEKHEDLGIGIEIYQTQPWATGCSAFAKVQFSTPGLCAYVLLACQKTAIL